MRNTALFLLTFLCTTFLVFSQNEPQIDYAGELSKSVEIPQSPEAAAFEKYGNVGASMYSGTPDISVPIYTINGREMDLPISLSYDASGVKVTQLASQVGLSWSLAVGGRISRVVNGMPDDYLQGDYATIFRQAGVYSAQEVRDNISSYSLISTDFSSLQEGQDYVNFLYDININKVDVEPDYFSINIPGLNDYILMDISSGGSLQAKALGNPNVKVEYTLISPGSINQWTVTLEDGTKYFFNLYETTYVTSQDGLNQVNNGVTKEYASSWVLTRMESPNKKDIFDFTYNDNNIAFNYWTQPFPIGASSVTNQLLPNSGTTEFPNPDSQVTYSPTYEIRQYYLTQIYHNTKLVVDFDLGPRLDIDRATNNYESALENITIHDFNGGILKQYNLFHTYFGATSYNNALTKDAFDVRLKLDSIQIKGNGANNRYASYQFEYISPDGVPSTQSTSQDYMGYYNGINNGNRLYPDITESGLHFHGANRSVDLNYAKKGNLQKIIYPTGGSTEFFYESHSYVPTSSSGTQIVKMIKGSCIVNNTQGNPYNAANCIVDASSGDINIQTCTFEIEEDDLYDIVFQGVSGMGFIHKLDYECTGGYDYNNPINPGNPPLIYPCLESSYVPIDSSTLCLDNNSGSVWQSGSNYDSETLGSNDPRVNLSSGVYQITLFNLADNVVPNSTLSIYISREEEIEVANAYSTIPAGLRVQKIIDNPEMGQSTVEKTYKYVTDITAQNPSSSGKLIFNPKLYNISSVNIQENGLWVSRVILNRVAQASGGNQPHVVYNKVYEIEQNNGYIAHSFKTGLHGIVASNAPPYQNRFVSDFEVGKESATTTFSETDVLLSIDTKTYSDNLIFSQRGFGLSNDPTRTYKFAAFEEIGGIFRLTYVDTWITPNGTEFPSECNSPTMHCIFTDAKYAPLEPINTLASGRAGHLSKNELYSYYENGTTDKVVDYIYDNNNLLKETITTDSEGNELKAKNYYSGDFLGITVYEDMFNDHRLNTVVKSESYYNGVKTSTQQTTYKKWGNSYLPEYIKASKDNLSLEDRIQYIDYDSKGNLQEATLTNGTSVVYVWGYNDQYPVAKIENVTIIQIEALSEFGSNFNLGSSGLTIPQENSLRNNLPNALITTYDYIPFVGVSKITDPRNQTIYYHYDDYHRLEYITDEDGKILSQNVYNYKN